MLPLTEVSPISYLSSSVLVTQPCGKEGMIDASHISRLLMPRRLYRMHQTV